MEVPLFVSYLKMILLLLRPLLVGIPSVLVIRVIVVVKELHTKYFFFLVNLLITDLVGVVIGNLLQFVTIVIYVSGINFKLPCVYFRIVDTPSIASQLLFITLGIDRFVAIVFPYNYKKIMTKRFALGMVAVVWGLAVLWNTILMLGVTDSYLEQFGKCYPLNDSWLYFLRWFMFAISTALIVVINIYLYYEVLLSNKRYEESMKLHGESLTTEKYATHKRRLKSHVKPTISVLLLGGLDGLFNVTPPLLYMLTILAVGNDDFTTRVYISEFLLFPIKGVQLMCHPLVYGLCMAKIRRRIFDFELYHRIFSRRSKVVVLNRQWRNRI